MGSGREQLGHARGFETGFGQTKGRPQPGAASSDDDRVIFMVYYGVGGSFLCAQRLRGKESPVGRAWSGQALLEVEWSAFSVRKAASSGAA